MFTPMQIHQKPLVESAPPGIPLSQTALNSILRMFVSTFGAQALRDHSDLKHYHYFENLIWYEAAIALQIAVDTTAACNVDDERVMRLKQRFRELLGPCEHETLVRIQNVPFVLERPPVPF